MLTRVSCSKHKGVKEIISRAESIEEQHPDSALKLLNTVISPEDFSNGVFNKYNLILLQAKDESYKDITSNTIIFSVKNYYSQNSSDALNC